MTAARSLVISTVALLFAVTAIKTGSAPVSTSTAETPRGANVACTVPHEKAPSLLQSTTLLGHTKKARRELLQEVILAMDEMPLEDLFDAITVLYPELVEAFEDIVQASGTISLQRVARRHQLRLILIERMVAEVSALDCCPCGHRVSATSG